MDAGYKNRSTAATKMNEHSSRSHSIFTIYIETSEESDKFDETLFKAGKLHLVDLAGSEKQKQTQANHDRLEEAKKINLSLSALGNVIKALVDGKSKHVPYRDSKLTRLLQDSLGGNTKTLMVAALSPSNDAYEETLGTLRYADRAKSITNKPKINEDPKDALLREYEDEIKKLKKMISELSSGGASASDTQNIQNAMIQMEKNFQGVMNNNHVEDNVDSLAKHKGSKKRIINEDEESLSEESEEGARTKSKRKKKRKNKKKQREHESSSEEEEEEDDELPNSKKKKHAKPRHLDSSIDFKGPIKELEKLEREKNALHEDKQQIEDKLKEQQKEVEIEKQQKAQLENILSKMQQKLVVGGKALEEKEKDRAKEVREMQLKLEKQKQVEKQLFKQKQQQEEEKLMVEQQYHDLQEEVDDNRKIIKELRNRYKAALSEIDDIKKENQDNNEDNLITIRDQGSEIEFYQKLVKNLLKPEEVSQIKAKSKQLEDGWSIPPFVLKKHEVNFPKLSRGKAKAMVEDEFNQRDIDFDISYNGENDITANLVTNNAPSTHKINKDTSSRKALNLEPGGILSPKSSANQRISYENNPPDYISKMNNKTQRHRTKKNISQQPPVNNMKNYANYSIEDDEFAVTQKSMKKPNPTLAPIQGKHMNVPNLSKVNQPANLEAMIPSVDELRRRRGDLQPLKHNLNSKLNNSFNSQE